jgi:dTDP-4-amino-4,6-dideoxygalactose transaminase
MIPLFKVFMDHKAALSALQEVLPSGYIGQGPKVEEFEDNLKEYFGTPYVLTVNSATSGLTLAFRMAKDATGRKEVISTPLTCTATNWAILANQMDILWADIVIKTCNICPDSIDSLLNNDVAAVSAVHWGGNPIDYKYINQQLDLHEAKSGYRPFLVEDCAHAFGSEYKGHKLGHEGGIAVYSLQAIKHITSVDGGVMVFPNEELYNKAKLLRWYGLDRESSADFRCSQDVADWGYKFHMNDVNAVIGNANLQHANDLISKHQANAKILNNELLNVPGIQTIEISPDAESAYWIYTILAEGRNDLAAKLKERGIMSSQVHARNDKHECVKDFVTDLPNMDVVDEEMLCIPCGWWLSNDNLDYIIDTIASGW